MNRSFLAGLGLDKETINQIMEENGKDVETAKGKKADYEQRISELESQISERDTQLENLKESTGNVEELNKKIEELQNVNKQVKTESEKRYKDLQVSIALEKEFANAGVKSAKAVKAFLDTENVEIDENGNVKGLKEKLESLRSDEETAFLFNIKQETKNEPPKISGITVNNGLQTPPEGNSYQTKWREAIKNHDTALAISIKSEAAAEGVYF